MKSENTKTLIIMGTHPIGSKTFDWARKNCEIWMFNEAPIFTNKKGELLYPKCDVCFQMHHEAIWKNPKNISSPNNYPWLISGKTPTIYMQKKFKEIPKSVEYPMDEVSALSKNLIMIKKGHKINIRYFSSTPDFAFALLANMWKQGKRYKAVEVHGIELEMESEYRFQRTGFAFWIGYLTALGVKITLYNSIFDSPMYGYEGDVIIPVSEFESRLAKLTQELGENKDSYNQGANIFIESLSKLVKRNTINEVLKQLNDLSKIGEVAGTLNGRIKENQRYLEMAKAMEEVAGTSVFAAGEFDNSRSAYNIQYQQVRTESVNLNLQIESFLNKISVLKKGAPKRKQTVEEFKQKMVVLINNNMLLYHVSGALKESQYYLDSVKQSYFIAIQD